MEVQTIQKFIHTTPRKLRLVADMVRKMQPEQALVTLKFTQKAAASELIDAISTAVANARMKGLSEVSFKKIEINEGPKMRRYKAGSRGRVKPFKRRMAHIKVVLTDEVVVPVERVKAVKTRKAQKVESVLGSQVSDQSETVVSEAVTEGQTTEQPISENREQETGNQKEGDTK